MSRSAHHESSLLHAALSRRAFLARSGASFGALAFSSLLARDGHATAPTLRPPGPDIAPRARSVIYLHMAGSPSQIDLFDPKPALRKWDGKPCPNEFLEGKRFAFIRGVPNLFASPFSFARCGRSGMELSSLWKHLPTVADDICLVRSMTTDQFNHSPAQLLLQTGTPQFGGAAFGSWVSYGLGRVADDLPSFVVLSSGGKAPDAGKSLWGSGFLPGVHQGVQCRTHGEPVLFLSDPKGLDRAGRRSTLNALKELNELARARVGDPETETRIAQYELAFRMQAAVPEVMDIRREPRDVLDLYGARPGHVSNLEGATDPRPITQGDDPTLANSCLLARRLVERGVRFVQLYDWGWDHHGVSQGEDIDNHLPLKVAQVDRAVTGLITDLKRRGLLDSTLVVFSGEFGRTPMAQNGNVIARGRDHHPFAFSLFLAGGGVKGGFVHGATDELGYYVTRDEVTVRDLQATLLHQLGLDAWKLTYPYQGLDQKWIGPEGKARVVDEILT